MDSIELRLAQLERVNQRSHKNLIVLIVACVGLLCLSNSAITEPGEVKATEFVLVDKQGKSLMRLATSIQGNPGLWFPLGDTWQSAIIGAPNDRPSFRGTNFDVISGGSRRALLSTSKGDEGGIWFYNGAGEQVGWVGKGADSTKSCNCKSST